MNSFGTVQRDAIDIDRTAPVRVQCEAQDCRALLEVNVTPDQRLDTPVIVRCGSCKRLLEVNLAQAQLASSNEQRQQTTTYPGQPPMSITGSLPGSGHGFVSGLTNKAPMLGQRPDGKALLDQEFTMMSPPTIRQHALIQPPPLSRQPTSQRKATLDNLSSQLSGPGLWYAPTLPYSSPTLDNFYPASNPLDLFSYANLPTGNVPTPPKPKQKKQKSHKPRNPSPYNIFMSQEVKQIKAANPSVDHKEAFKMAASNWAKSPNNCSNRRLPAPFETPFTAAESEKSKTEENEKTAEIKDHPKEEPEEGVKQTSAMKRHPSEVIPEDSANIEEKRRKTDIEFLEKSTCKTAISAHTK